MANPLIHWELMVEDVERSKAFYKKVFDWTFEPAGPEYTLIQTGTAPGGGLLKRLPGVAMSSFNSYFQVRDLERTLLLAARAGARALVPITEVPNVGRFAMFLDLDQIPIGVMQLQ